MTYPPDLIAQFPCSPRDSSRLMVVNRATGDISEITFRDIIQMMEPEDSFVFNNTKVIPARLLGQRPNGGEAEIFLIRRLSSHLWETLGRPGKKLRPGTHVFFGQEFSCTILETLPNGNKLVQFEYEDCFEKLLEKYGQMPLPMYIKRDVKDAQENQRYQTVYAQEPGALAAPTAGLHFTDSLLQALATKGVGKTSITLHVGLGTFRPVQTNDIRNHLMHTEHFIISPEAAATLNRRPEGKRQICVGTTCCRALETAANAHGQILPGSYDTDIFIHPGYKFKYVKALLTNFHIPGSTLLMLVSAFAGHELTMKAYAKAIKERYRFYSYGDAMLII